MSFERAIHFFHWLLGVAFWHITAFALLAMPVLADVSDDDSDDYDPLPGRTAEQIDALIFNFDEVVETIVLYTALVSLLAILLTLAASMRLWRWVGYIVLTITSLIWFAFFEQHVTGLYWIGADVPDTTLILLAAPLISAHFFFAGWYIASGSRLRLMRPVLLVATLAPWVVLALDWPVTVSTVPLLFGIIGVLACISHILTISSFDTVPDQPLNSKRNVIVVAVALALTLFAVFGELDEGLDTSFAIRSIFVAVVCLFAFFLVQFVISVLRERDASVRRSLATAQREAEQARALLEAEKNYARAKETARKHTMRLATASHDIRQPIASLRATMAAVAKGQSREIQTQLKAAFDYLDQLAKSYMETEDAPNAPAVKVREDDGREPVSAQMLCGTLERMFRKEAEAKGLAFEVTVEDRELNVPPLVVTRILSNLLSNAIKHTQAGHVALCAGPQDQGYGFSVTNSSAMSDMIKEQGPFQHGLKEETSDGSGFGLAIVETLAQANGLALEWSSTKVEGTQFMLLIRDNLDD